LRILLVDSEQIAQKRPEKTKNAKISLPAVSESVYYITGVHTLAKDGVWRNDAILQVQFCETLAGYRRAASRCQILTNLSTRTTMINEPSGEAESA
jgi:hypothetical protein